MNIFDLLDDLTFNEEKYKSVHPYLQAIINSMENNYSTISIHKLKDYISLYNPKEERYNYKTNEFTIIFGNNLEIKSVINRVGSTGTSKEIILDRYMIIKMINDFNTDIAQCFSTKLQYKNISIPYFYSTGMDSDLIQNIKNVYNFNYATLINKCIDSMSVQHIRSEYVKRESQLRKLAKENEIVNS